MNQKSQNPLLDYTGAYRIKPHHEIIIAQRSGGGQTVLTLTDLQTDQIRMLFPADAHPDLFIAGPNLTRAEPVQYRCHFIRDADGCITAVSMTTETGVCSNTSLAQKQPLRSEPVAFSNGSLTLKGTLHLPPSSPFKIPAVLLAHGSEAFDQHGFGDLPLALASHGLAALAYDKRGTGASGGDWESAGLEDLAEDLLAGLARLQFHSEIDPGRIGIMGFSEGGWIAPLAAARAPDDIRFIISISGGAFTKGASFIHKYRCQFIEEGLQGEALEKALAEKSAIVRESIGRVAGGLPLSGFDRRITYDPAEDWQRFKGSILFLGGEFDVLEDAAASACRLQECLKAAGHPDATIKTFPKAHHGLLLGENGGSREFFRMDKIRQYVPGFWQVLWHWLETRGLNSPRKT